MRPIEVRDLSEDKAFCTPYKVRRYLINEQDDGLGGLPSLLRWRIVRGSSNALCGVKLELKRIKYGVESGGN